MFPSTSLTPGRRAIANLTSYTLALGESCSRKAETRSGGRSVGQAFSASARAGRAAPVLRQKAMTAASASKLKNKNRRTGRHRSCPAGRKRERLAADTRLSPGRPETRPPAIRASAVNGPGSCCSSHVSTEKSCGRVEGDQICGAAVDQRRDDPLRRRPRDTGDAPRASPCRCPTSRPSAAPSAG